MFAVQPILELNATSAPPPVDGNTGCSAWITEFTSRHTWLCVIDDEYVNDNFNLYGISAQVQDYQNALQLVRGNYRDSPTPALQKRAGQVYGLMHARYILTFQGAFDMQSKYEQHVFGTCPRVACQSQPLLPIGMDHRLEKSHVRGFCPCCEDIYNLHKKLDGAYFGPYFAHFFLQAVETEVRCPPRVAASLCIFGVPIDEEPSALNRNRSVHSQTFV
jgi:hypothetical protein